MIDVSIIIPAYNKRSLLKRTLYALEKQNYRLSNVEVIVIDDGSTDGTWKRLRYYKPPFRFRLIRNRTNIGRAATRNKGIRIARGRVLIFLDAEIIAGRDLIKNHMRYHAKEDHAVVSGVFGEFRKMFSVIYPTFNKLQFEQCYSVLQNEPHLRSRFKNPERLMRGFHLPWVSFLTGNVSVTKKSLTAAGLFDESFQGYGFEDWELGYRLFLNGAKFIAGTDIISYHQEHPYDETTRYHELKANHLKFFEKYNDVGIGLLVLHEKACRSLIEISETVKEYAELCEEFPDSFAAFKTNFHQYCKRLIQDKTDHMQLPATFLSDSPEVQSDISELQQMDRFPQLLALTELK